MIEFNGSTIQEAERLLGGIKDALPKAQANAINRSLSTTRAETVRAVREDYIVSADSVRKSIVLKTASASNPVGAVISKGSPIALSNFDAGGKPVKARVKKGSSPKPIKSSFEVGMKSGHTGVFKRKGKARLPIQELYGPSIPQMIGSENVIKKIEEKAMETLDKRMDHEINRVLERGRL